jgi:hypothetical protein
MPAKVTISIVGVTTIEIEIPDKCPECGADLTETESIRETGYVAYSSPGHIEKDPRQVAIQCENETDFADSMITRHECLACSHTLAEG